MKKLLSVIMALVLIAALAACKEKKGEITWGGLEERIVIRGDEVDLLEGVTATDSIDGDITDKIKIIDDGDFSSDLAGGYEVKYEVTNSTGVTETKTKQFVVRIGHNVADGSFSLNGLGWSFDKPGGNAVQEVKNGEAVITINDPGTQWWSLQFYQTGLKFESGKTYKLSFKAKSPDGRSISGSFEDIDDGYAMMNPGFNTLKLTNEYQEYETYFTATKEYLNVKAVIYLGYQLEADAVQTDKTHTVYIDDVKISVVDNVKTLDWDGVDDVELVSGSDDAKNFKPLDGVSVKENGKDVTDKIKVLGDLPVNVQANSSYYITYKVTLSDGSLGFYHRKVTYTMPKNHEYENVNGQFDYGFMGWVKDVNQTQGTGQANFIENNDGTVSIEVVNVSDAGWHIQLQQATSVFRKGETYVVRVVIKADEARAIDLEVVDPNNGFQAIMPTQRLNLTTEWQIFEYQFTAENNYDVAKLGLLLGNVDGMQPHGVTIDVDEFQVYKYDPFDEEFDVTEESKWNFDRISGEIADGKVTVEFVDEANADPDNDKFTPGPNPWDNQLYQNGFRLVSGHKYKIEVAITSSIDRNIRVWIEDAANGYSPIATGDGQTFTLTANEETVCTYEVEITDELATNDAKFVVMFGDGDIQGQAHTITIDYFRVTDLTVAEAAEPTE